MISEPNRNDGNLTRNISFAGEDRPCTGGESASANALSIVIKAIMLISIIVFICIYYAAQDVILCSSSQRASPRPRRILSWLPSRLPLTGLSVARVHAEGRRARESTLPKLYCTEVSSHLARSVGSRSCAAMPRSGFVEQSQCRSRPGPSQYSPLGSPSQLLVPHLLFCTNCRPTGATLLSPKQPARISSMVRIGAISKLG